MEKLRQLLLGRKPADRSTDPLFEDYQAHMYLGNLYSSMGDFARAESEYVRAHALHPCDESRKQLAEIQKRRADRCSSTGKPGSAARAA